MKHMESTRREFMQTTMALGATGLAAAASAQEAAKAPTAPAPAGATSNRRQLGPDDAIRCGFIGVGSRGSSVLHSTLSIKQVDVVAIADTYDVWRDRAVGWCKEKQPSVGSYVRFEDMLDKEDLDAVVIAAPDHIHFPAILPALDRGLDVYTEKPMTLTWQTAKELRARVAQTGAVLQVGTQLRSMPMYQKARDVFQSGQLGPLVLVQVNRHHGSGRLDPTKTPAEADEQNVHWQAFLRDTQPYPYDPLRYFHWRQFLEYSNGYFGDLMLHHLDICHFITGCGMPHCVKAVGGVYHFNDGRTCPDTLSALIEYPERFHFNYTTTAANGHYGLVERYLCTKGTIEIRGMDELSIFRDEAEEKIPSSGIKNEPHLQDFFDCVRSRGKPIAPVEAGFMAAACAHMAMASTQSGKAAHWDPDQESAAI